MDARTYISALEAMGLEEYRQTANYRVKVPMGRSGPWIIFKFGVRVDLQYLRFARDGRPPGVGEFTGLAHRSRGIVMSDTVAEIKDLVPYLKHLKGHVLVSGLGLGMVVHTLTKHPLHSREVTNVTVVEKDEDVIKLSGKFYRQSDPRVRVVHADTFEWKPQRGETFDSAWHDIWDWVGDDDVREQMSQLKRHHRKWVRGRQHCWGAPKR